MVQAIWGVVRGLGSLLIVVLASCPGPAVQILPVSPEQPGGGPISPVSGQGVLVIRNDSENLPVTCALVRITSFDPDNPNIWGVNRLPGGTPVSPDNQAQLSLAEGLYDIAVIRPSLDPDASNNDETHRRDVVFIEGGKVLTITVNDFSFEDIEPDCD